MPEEVYSVVEHCSFIFQIRLLALRVEQSGCGGIGCFQYCPPSAGIDMFLRSWIAVHSQKLCSGWELVVYRTDKVEGARMVTKCGKKPPWEREFLCSQRTTEITYDYVCI